MGQATTWGADDILVYVEGSFGQAQAVLAYFDAKLGFSPMFLITTTGNVVNDVPVGRVPPSAGCDSLLIGYLGRHVRQHLPDM